MGHPHMPLRHYIQGPTTHERWLVFYITGHKIPDLGGLYKTMPLTMICGILAHYQYLHSSTSGFISKSLTVQATVYEELKML